MLRSIEMEKDFIQCDAYNDNLTDIAKSSYTRYSKGFITCLCFCLIKFVKHVHIT